MGGFEFWDHLSFLKAGVMFSDLLTTVSPTYAEEIQRPEYGYGFEGVMRLRADALIGILNGIEVDEWDPGARSVSADAVRCRKSGGKTDSKRALLQQFGLPSDAAALKRPVIGMVSRLVDQKGLDLIEALSAELPRLDAAFTIVGIGRSALRVDVAFAFGRLPGSHFRLHRIQRGARAPGRGRGGHVSHAFTLRALWLEPDVQHAVRHGAHRSRGRRVGRLGASLQSQERSGHRLSVQRLLAGALFATPSSAAIATYQQRSWRRLQTNGMKKDFSWDRSAAEYLKVYKRVIAARRKTGPIGGLPRYPIHGSRHLTVEALIYGF